MDNSDTGGHMLAKLNESLRQDVEELVPWFYAHMPEYYFRTHSEQEQLDHLHAIVSARVRTEKQTVTLRSPCGTRVTHLMPGAGMGKVVETVSTLAKERIQTARLYSSDDMSFRLDTYLLGAQPLCTRESKDFNDAVQAIGEAGLMPVASSEDFKHFLSTASEDYVAKFEPGRAIRHFELCNCVQGTERVHLRLDSEAMPGSDRVMVAVANPPKRGVLLAALKIFSREGCVIQRAYGDEFDHNGENLLVMSFYLDSSQTGLTQESELWKRIARQLKTIKWFAFHGLERFAEDNGWEIGRVMLMQAACEFAHQFLIRKNMYMYTSSTIVRAALKHRDAVALLVRYFETRFDPDFVGERDAALETVREEIHEALRDVTDDVERKILGYILRFFRHVLRTNYYMPERFGISFRMDPKVLPKLEQEEPPYGFYCFH
ncbi:MAG: NAD-glutamate dehydrogenase, partial [Proteobacteria bacterium]|nr:NAD-glutamate dehydrogenase [Pseudomonadota bacterium]MBU1610307.1 NAD-glutamate dehydrogenase [Pseudomonadota bacterium]